MSEAVANLPDDPISADVQESALARAGKALLILLPFFLSAAAFAAGREISFSYGVGTEFIPALQIMALTCPVWQALLLMPGTWRTAGVTTAFLAIYCSVFAGLAVLVDELFGLRSLPIVAFALLLQPLLLAILSRSQGKVWIEEISNLLRRGLLRGLVALGAGAITFMILSGGTSLIQDITSSGQAMRWPYWLHHSVDIAAGAISVMVAVQLAWEKWSEPLIRRFWALVLPLLLLLGLALAALFPALGGAAPRGMTFTANFVLATLAASILFAAGTKQHSDRFTRWSRLAALPIALVAAWLLVQAIQADGLLSDRFFQGLALIGVLLASIRIWLVSFRPSLWLPEGLVTMVLPLLALVGMFAPPPTERKQTQENRMAVVWPVGAAIPEEVVAFFKRPYTCGPTNFCQILLQDLDEDGQVEVINLTQGTILRKNAQEWVYVGSIFSEEKGSNGIITAPAGRGVPIEDIQSVETVVPKFKDLLINGRRVRVSLY